MIAKLDNIIRRYLFQVQIVLYFFWMDFHFEQNVSQSLQVWFS